MQTGPLSEQVAELDAFARKELSQAQRDLNEVRLLIRQTAGEVERLTQRSGQAVAKQREAETNLENLSRQDLRQIFVSSCDSQLRLFMMQAQSEQLQSRQRSLEMYVGALQRTVEVTASASSFDGVPVTNAAPPLSPSPLATVATEDHSTRRQTIAKIIQAQEDERNRVARQIHDGPAQTLTNVVLRAEICERLLDRDLVKARAELGQLKDMVAGALRDTRRFIFDVRPMILDDLGVFPTLRKYVEAFQEKSRFPVDLTVVGQDRRFEPHVEVTVFRIVQEALHNVAQHASASSARVTLNAEGEEIGIVVEDDGVGFDVDEVLARAREHRGNSLGIASMLQRAEMLGGTVRFERTPSCTKLIAAIPLAD